MGILNIDEHVEEHRLMAIRYPSKAVMLRADLDGVSGGQTLIGSTASGENLTLRSTVHATKGAIIFGSASEYDEANDRLGIGTLTPSAKIHAISNTEQLRLGYDASNYLSATIASTGLVTLTGTIGQYSMAGPTNANATATLGNDLIINGAFTTDLSGWTVGAGWAWSAGAALHSSGTATLEQSVTITSGSTYQVDVTISGRTAGTIAVALGAVSAMESGANYEFSSTLSRTVVAGASGSVLLSITPTSDFNGAIDNVSVKLVTLGSFPAAIGITEGGSAATEIRQSLSRLNLSVGISSGSSITNGSSNTNLGRNAGFALTTGSNNTNCGRDAGSGITVGHSNSNFGVSAGLVTTSGHSNCNFGRDSGRAITTGSTNTNIGIEAGAVMSGGSSNTSVGAYAGRGITSGSNNSIFGRDAGRSVSTTSANCAFGNSAGRFLADGTSLLTTPANCCYFGASTKASADAVTNENVFGYNATGIGSNSCVIGSSAVTKCQLYGDIILDKTVTASGTTGAQTINKTVGSVNFAAGASSLVVTNSRVTTASVIIATVATNDTTLKSVVAVAGSGSFTLTANAAATAETRVNFIVIN